MYLGSEGCDGATEKLFLSLLVQDFIVLNLLPDGSGSNRACLGRDINKSL